MLRDTNDQKDQKEKPFFSFSLSSVFLVDLLFLLPLRCVQKGQLTKLVSLPSPFFPRYPGLPPSFTPLPTFFSLARSWNFAHYESDCSSPVVPSTLLYIYVSTPFGIFLDESLSFLPPSHQCLLLPDGR